MNCKNIAEVLRWDKWTFVFKKINISFAFLIDSMAKLVVLKIA